MDRSYVSSKIKFINDIEFSKVVANQNIKSGEIIIIEYPKINLFGEKMTNRELKILEKYLENKNNSDILKLYPRTNSFLRTELIKSVHKLIESVKKSDKKLYENLIQYSKNELEFYFAKYIFNAFEGNMDGPLTLPLVARFNHSCNPNVKFKFDNKTKLMSVQTIRNIKKGEELFDSYLENKSIINHRDYLYNHYGFYCDCIR